MTQGELLRRRVLDHLRGAKGERTILQVAGALKVDPNTVATELRILAGEGEATRTERGGRKPDTYAVASTV